MNKIKVTLSLREDIVKSVRSKLAMEGRNLSDVVEEFLLTYNELEFLNATSQNLGLRDAFYTSAEIKADRPDGAKAEDIVREIRDERAKHLFRQQRHS
jgi:hypothetical protein